MCLSTNKSKHRCSDQNSGRSWTESVIVWKLSGIFLRLFIRHTQFFKWTAYRKPYGKCLVKYSAHFVAYFFFKQRDVRARFWSVFKVCEQVSILFSIHRFFYEVLDIFPRLSYRLTFIMLNVGMVDNLEFW